MTDSKKTKETAPNSLYQEVALYDRISNKEEVRHDTFLALNYPITTISFLPNFVGPIRELIPKDRNIAVCIDYPFGCSPTVCRTNAALLAIRSGAKFVDVPLNHTLYSHTDTPQKSDKFLDDILALLSVCKANSAFLRVFLEYRLYSTKENILLGAVLDELGVEYVFPSTGYQMDDFTDNYSVAAELTKETNLKVIVNAPIKKPSEYETLVKSSVFGYRFAAVGLLRHFLKAIKATKK